MVLNMSETPNQETATQPLASISTNVPAKSGRPPGYPKTGGRTKGTPNKRPAVAQLIADKASPDAMKLLVAVMRGERIAHLGEWFFPEPHQRINAAQTILRKSVPDLQGLRHSGPQGEPLAVNIVLGVYRAESA